MAAVCTPGANDGDQRCALMYNVQPSKAARRRHAKEILEAKLCGAHKRIRELELQLLAHDPSSSDSFDIEGEHVISLEVSRRLDMARPVLTSLVSA